MGNSLLDVVVFGRRAGLAAAERATGMKKGGKLSLSHLSKFHKELKSARVGKGRVAPMLLPEYRRQETVDHRIDALD